MNREAFKKRMQSLKSYRENNPGKGYWEWRNSLPDNLKYTDDLEYDMKGAYESGAQPILENDGLYHLPSRDPKSGKILKSSTHPTYWKALTEDDKMGYKTYFVGRDTYTWNNENGPFIPWQKSEQFQTGGEKTGYTTYNAYGDVTHHLPVSLEENTLNIGLPDIVVTPRNNLNLASVVTQGRNEIARGIADAAAYVTPLGDVEEVYQIYKDTKAGNYGSATAGLALMALPGNIGKLFREAKTKYGKQSLIRAIYNNVAPGSYHASYIPGGTKKTEIKNALKDYIRGKGDKIDPKWRDWLNEGLLSQFASTSNTSRDNIRFIEAATGAREEAWMNYLGIPHEDKYLISTGSMENGMPVYRSNVTAVPNNQLQELVNHTSIYKPEQKFVALDYINSTGGSIGVSFKDQGDIRTITTEDIWDINPFKEANRAKILPSWIHRIYSHTEVLPDGYKKRVWNDNAPKWLTDFEPSRILGTPGPFLNRTKINARKLTKDQLFRQVIPDKNRWVNERLDIESELVDPEFFDTDYSYKQFIRDKRNQISSQYDELLKNDPDRLKVTVPVPEDELLSRFGLHVRFQNGGEVTNTRPVVNKDLVMQNLGKSTDEIMALQNERQKEFARYWYTERAKQAKYQSQLGNGNLEKVLGLIDNSTYRPFGDLHIEQFQRQNPTAKIDELYKQELIKDAAKKYQGFAYPEVGQWSSRVPPVGKSAATTWHEGIGHIVGDSTPEILNAADAYKVRGTAGSKLNENEQMNYDNYRNQPNEKHAETWGFRGANVNMKDDNGNYYIDPNRQLTGDDVQEMINKGAIIPDQFKGLTPEQIATRHNTFAYNNATTYGIPMAQNGGEIQGQYALQPIQPSRMQTIGRRILDTATGFLPIAGDLQSIGDAYTAARNRDWLGLGLAGLGIVPFIPTVNKGAISNAIDKVFHRQAKANKVLEEFNRQRDDVYESLIENEEAYRRAANADRTSGSNYLGTYQQLIREHGSDNLRDKVRMEFDPNLYSTSTKAQVNPHDPTYITINTRYKDPDELDDAFKQMNPGLIRHEMGHITDVRAGLDYTDKLADPAKFVSDEKLKEMFPSNYKNFRTRILNRGSEIKSYMNEFRQFLYDRGDRDTKETVKSFRRKLDVYGKDFKNLRMIFDSYKNPKQFIKDYNSVPLTSTDRNKNLV